MAQSKAGMDWLTTDKQPEQDTERTPEPLTGPPTPVAVSLSSLLQVPPPNIANVLVRDPKISLMSPWKMSKQFAMRVMTAAAMYFGSASVTDTGSTCTCSVGAISIVLTRVTGLESAVESAGMGCTNGVGVELPDARFANGDGVDGVRVNGCGLYGRRVCGCGADWVDGDCIGRGGLRGY